MEGDDRDYDFLNRESVVRKLVPMSGFDELCCDSCSNTRPSAIQVNTQHGSAAQRMLFKNCRTDVIRHIIYLKE